MTHFVQQSAKFQTGGLARRVARLLITSIALAFATVSYGDPGLAIRDAEDTNTQESGPAGFVDRQLIEIGTYDDQHRLQAYASISDLFDHLWLNPESRKVLIRNHRSKLGNMVFQLEDRDADGEADFYAYYQPGKYEQTQDFGAFFDLSRDGQPDWIVFYGGLMFTKDFKALYWHQHGIDTNGDKKFDTWVIGAIDIDGDGFVDDNVTAWIQDADHDGLVDKAYHVAEGRVLPIKPKGKRLPLRSVMSFAQPRIGKPITNLFDKIAADITANIKGD